MKHFAGGMKWGEGPRWHDGALWLSDTQGSRLWSDTSGVWTAYELASPCNGLWFLPDGRLAAAMMNESRIGVWQQDRFETYADLRDVATGALGDIVGDAQGNLYVDDLGPAADPDGPPRSGRILRVGADGQIRVVAEGLEFPNGMAIIHGGSVLVVAETLAQRLTAFDIGDDGQLSGRRTYADIAALVGPAARPDGLWPEGDGIWVATTTGQAVVQVRDGQVVRSISTGPEFPIACCTDDDGRLLVTLVDAGGRPLMDALANKSVRARVAVVGA